MKSQQTPFLFLLSLAAAGLVAACSVKSESVADRPPVIPDSNLSQSAVEYGVLLPQSFSVFLWPQGLTDVQLQHVIYDVSTKSQQLDKLGAVVQGKTAQITSLENDFTTQACADKWAATIDDGDPTVAVPVVTAWKQPDPTIPGSAAAIQACSDNQTTRQQLASDIDNIAQNQERPLAAAIFLDIDPGYPSVVVNTKSITPQGSRITIQAVAGGPAHVDVQLQDFITPGNTQSTTQTGPGQIRNAAYNPANKVLTFQVPELDSSGIPTGGVYEFDLARFPQNYLNYARFAGELTYMAKDGSVRHGQAKIDGILTAQ